MTIIGKRSLLPGMPFDGTHFSKNRPFSDHVSSPQSDHACFMLTEIYIEALLVDKQLADQVWYMWNADVIDDSTAWLAWWLLYKQLKPYLPFLS